MIRYVAMHRKDGPLHALEETSPPAAKSSDKKPSRKRKQVSPEQIGRQPKKNVLPGRESLYRLLAENVSDVIWVSDLRANLVYISPSVTRQIGYTPEEIMSHPLTVTTRRHLRQAIQKALHYANPEPQRKGNSARPIRMAVTRKDGALVWTETYMSVLQDRRGRGETGADPDLAERR